MSITNEQRAHDLAIATLPFIQEAYQSKSYEAGSDSDDYKFDVYKEYILAYQMALESFNSNYPNGM